MGKRLGILSIFIDDKTVTVTFLVEKTVGKEVEHTEETVYIEISDIVSTYELKIEWEKGWAYGKSVVEYNLMTEEEVGYKLDEIDRILQEIEDEIEKQKNKDRGR